VPDTGLKNLRWTIRFAPRTVRLPSSNTFWYEEANLVLFEPTGGPVELPIWASRPVVPLDLHHVRGAIETDPEARAFFLDLACWLLVQCAEAAARAGGLGGGAGGQRRGQG